MEWNNLITLIEDLSNISIEKLVNKLDYLEEDEIIKIKRAYEFAYYKHQNQYRKSGEPYITHPLSVAYILSYFYKPDKDAIIASLLHDVIEDTETPLIELEKEFGIDVATLVDSVSKFKSKNFKNKTEKVAANQRKLMMSILKDPRSVIIKICDNFHNILTLQYHRPEKRIENAKESLELYVPIARQIGMNSMVTMISDLTLKYINTEEENKKIQSIFSKFIHKNYNHLIELKKEMEEELRIQGLDYEAIEMTYKDLYSINELLSKGYHLHQLRDLIQFKLIVKNTEECKKAYTIISKKYPIFYENFRDYITCPKAEVYKSIDGPIEQNIMLQIRTKQMDKMAQNGLASYWELYEKNAKKEMLEILKNKSNLYAALTSMDSNFPRNSDFFKAVPTIINPELDSTLYGTINENPLYSGMIRRIIENYFNNELPTIAQYNLGMEKQAVYTKK